MIEYQVMNTRTGTCYGNYFAKDNYNACLKACKDYGIDFYNGIIALEW